MARPFPTPAGGDVWGQKVIDAVEDRVAEALAAAQDHTDTLEAALPATILDATTGKADRAAVAPISALPILSVRNYCGNPNLLTDATGWSTGGFGTAGAGTSTRVVGTGAGGSNGYEIQWTTASTQTGVNTGPDIGPYADAARKSVVPGDVVSGSIYAKSTVTANVFAVINFYNGGSFLSRSTSTVTTLQPGEERRLRIQGAVAPPNATRAAVSIRMNNVIEMGVGKLILSRAQITTGYQPLPYVDGSLPGGRWVGTAGASDSLRLVGGGTGTIAVYGDSHIQLAHGGGRTLPEWLSYMAQAEVLNHGRGGETSTGVAIRNGGLALTVTASGGNIPASGAVNVTVSTTTTFRDDTTWNFYGRIAGIYGTLVRAVGGQWAFTRQDAGSVTAATNAPFESFTASDTAHLTILEGGNNLPNQADVLRDFAAMVARVESNGGRYLVLSLYNNAGEPTGSAGYNTVAAINAALAAAYGDRFVDVRSWLVANGLATAGITPTAGDVTALAEDRIAPSLMADTIHLNDAGRQVVGMRIAAVIAAKHYLE